ncbi:MAG: outer membrane beta-barrel protein [Nitrospirota bacterium]
MFRRLHAISVGTDLALIESLSLRLAYIYRRKDFTSELLGDTHLNRHDDNHQGMAEFRYRLNQAATLSASFQRTQRNSTVVTRDFNDTIYSRGGSCRFEAIALCPYRWIEPGEGFQSDWHVQQTSDRQAVALDSHAFPSRCRIEQ